MRERGMNLDAVMVWTLQVQILIADQSVNELAVPLLSRTRLCCTFACLPDRLYRRFFIGHVLSFSDP